MRSIAVVPFVLMLQSISLEPAVDLVTKAGLAGLILWLWREDRKSRESAATKADERYDGLVRDFRGIVESNTKAMAGLQEALRGRVVDCPWAMTERAMSGDDEARRILAERRAANADR